MKTKIRGAEFKLKGKKFFFGKQSLTFKSCKAANLFYTGFKWGYTMGDQRGYFAGLTGLSPKENL